MMTLIENELFDVPATPAGADSPRHERIRDVAAWLDRQHGHGVRPTLQALGELLLGITERDDSAESAGQFTARCLGVAHSANLCNESYGLSPLTALTTAVALAEWIHEHACELGPGESTRPPKWTQTDISGQMYRHPESLRAHFLPGTLLDDTGCVIEIQTRETMMCCPEVCVYVLPERHTDARAILDRLRERANALNPYHGRVVRAALHEGLSFTVITLPEALTRETVVVEDEVWTEVDLGIASVRTHHELLNAHGLGARRGVLLCGPPGTGKSAVSAVVAKEVVGEFTVMYVEARAGANLLTQVVEEAQRIGGPVLLVLEDVDLWCRDRKTGGGGLSELLTAMDISPSARILTLASTNDAETLDKAAIRTGRFDSIVEVGYPTSRSASRILTALVAGLPGSEHVDSDIVAHALPGETTGSDIRELVRRSLLASNGAQLSTAALLAEISSRRYQAAVPDGMYL